MKIERLRTTIMLFACVVVMHPFFSRAEPINIPGFYGPVVTPPPGAALPVLRPSGTVTGIAGFENPSSNVLVIHQDKPKAVIDWSSFNIGADARTHFDQKKNSNWVALNRIYDLNPSMLFGSLTADGKVYLINQNGILFGPDSKVNVHTLVASALNIRDSDFMNGIFKFYNEKGVDYPGLTFNPLAAVSNHGKIITSREGAVFLLGPRVENSGVINAPVGQVAMAAGTGIDLVADPGGERSSLIVDVKEVPGEVRNMEGAQLRSDEGWVGMYGREVHHDGIIRSVTAVKRNGQVELRATEIITTGAGSVLESLISSSSEKADKSFNITGGTVWLGGLQTVGGSVGGIQSFITKSPPALIVHKGVIKVPSGRVFVDAGERAFFETGSRIDVSGAWSDAATAENVVEVQLNSVELRDSHNQKNGLLQGKTIAANTLTGSSIGDISGAILTAQKTALRKAINGGSIEVTVNGGDIILKRGSTLDISGGGISYSGNFMQSTKLLSGSKVYDIANAPDSIRYDKLLGLYEKTYERYGITERFEGIYYGGASPLKTTGSFKRGGDAGFILMKAKHPVVLDGRINASVTQGFFQTRRTLLDSFAAINALELSREIGLETPRAGLLSIDFNSIDGEDSVIVLTRDKTPLPDGFGSGSVLADAQTVISTYGLNSAGLENLYLYSGAKIETESDARIDLAPGGIFSALSGRIEHAGEISVPAGMISMKTLHNARVINSSQDRGIYLKTGSLLDVAGERINNSLAIRSTGASIDSGQIYGGAISLWDQTNPGRGVFVQNGAVLDVSGGYRIDLKGKVTGADAGTLEIRGKSLMLNGELRGYALADGSGKYKGGSVVLHADEIDVVDTVVPWPTDFASGSPVPDGLKGKLVLAGDRFSNTGFTSVELNSFNEITVGESVELALSHVRLRMPVPGGIQGANIMLTGIKGGYEAVSDNDDLVRLGSLRTYELGPSAFKAVTGKIYPWQNNGSGIEQNSNAGLSISRGAVIRTGPEGKISINATGGVTMAGTLEAPAGSVGIKAGADLIINESGRILTGGLNRPDVKSTVVGLGHNSTPLSGGNVTLSASDGNITLAAGSLLDLSGSDAVVNRVLSGGKVVTFTQAAGSGSLYVTYNDKLTLNGRIEAEAKAVWVHGGGLSLFRTSNVGSMNVTGKDVARYVKNGFDDITLKSNTSLQLSGSADVRVGRKLTLDGGTVSGFGPGELSLRSPWIVLANTSDMLPGDSVETGEARLRLSSTGWLDLKGKVNLTGFKTVRLEALRDIRLTELLYGISDKVLGGGLKTVGDLILKADRIYPTARSSYGLRSTGGRVAIFPADNPMGGGIFSAGGKLIVEAAEGIEVRGTLAAPMGSITLKGTGSGSRVYLADGSLVTTVGNAMVNYGEIDDNGAWVLRNRVLTSTYEPMSPPQDISVAIEAPEVIIRSKAVIDVSGGDSVFAYLFQPGVEGSVNPLTKGNRYVVMSDRSVQLPGERVYLSGGAGLDVGEYSLLPNEYAFLPGAVVLEKRNIDVNAGQSVVTKDGYSVVSGYSTIAGTGLRDVRPKAYAVITAQEVLSQGHFDRKTLKVGDAGDVTLKGDTVVIDGLVSSAAVDGYQGGKISLSATEILVQKTVSPLPGDFDFRTVFSNTPELRELKGKLSVTTASLTGHGFKEIDLGDTDDTSIIRIMEGAALEAPVISLGAKDSIIIGAGAELRALTDSGIGEINLNSPGGMAVINPGAVLHASHVINLNVADQNIQGDLLLDHSALTLKGVNVLFVPQEYIRTGPGLYITKRQWDRIRIFDDIKLVSDAGLLFMDDFDLSVVGSLSIDASAITGVKAGGSKVSLTAHDIHLFNSKDVSDIEDAADNDLFDTNDTSDIAKVGRIDINGSSITVGGDILFDGFSTVSLNSMNDLTLKGVGSLKTKGADLLLKAARVTTAFDRNETTPYIAANFLIDAGVNSITMLKSGGVQGTSSVSGGILKVSAGKIDLSGLVEVDAGRVKMTATGSYPNSGIFIHSGGQILSRGDAFASGGVVSLRADNGVLVMDKLSTIDVSAGIQGDAGSIVLSAPLKGATLNGVFSGGATDGLGGSFAIDTKGLDRANMKQLIGALAHGGFNESLAIRVRTGNLNVVAGQTIEASHIKLSADDLSFGQINVSGIIDAIGENVELYAMNDLNIDPEGLVRGTGGNVLLSSSEGRINLRAGGTVYADGSLYLRSQRSGNDMLVNLDGTISNATAIYAEAVKKYSYTVSSLSAGNRYHTWLNESAAYYNANSAFGRLKGAAPAGVSTFHLLPGIEVVNSGDIDMDVAYGLDLTNVRYGSVREPGVLTMRAGENLNIKTNIVDHPTQMFILPSLQPGSTERNSWGVNLAAGSDTSGADYLAVVRGHGDLTVTDAKLVYTEKAPIRFASGNDTFVGRGAKPSYMTNYNMQYSLASYGGTVTGDVGQDLIITGGAIQTATGDIKIDVGRDLILKKSFRDKLGSIRTTGKYRSLNKYYKYAGGGDITLNVGRHVAGVAGDGHYISAISNKAWYRPYGRRPPRKWGASYIQSSLYGSTAGLAAMGGGGLSVSTGGDFLSQAGTFGKGDMVINAGGDVRGRFLSKQGSMAIHAMGNFGARGEEQVIEAFDSRIKISALGDIDLGVVANPTIAGGDKFGGGGYWNFTYTQDTSIALRAGGDVTFTGDNRLGNIPLTLSVNERILPGTVDIEAGGDIMFKKVFALAPSQHGNLRLIAGGDIDGSAIHMSDMDPAQAYRSFKFIGGFGSSLFDSNRHGDTVLHRSDSKAVEIRAGRDITNLNLYLPKKAEIIAGRDVRHVYYFGQNVSHDDVSMIKAGRDILFAYKPNSLSTGFLQAGPGTLVVQAGNSLDLGNSNGIQSKGNEYNPQLGSEGSSVVVVAGYSKGMTIGNAGVFFDELRNEIRSGSSYTESSFNARKNIIPSLGQPTGSGDINMTVSQISTSYGKSDIFIIANGEFNVGKSTFFGNEALLRSTGILTSEGGAINIFSGGDVNVNESRVMTFLGGDITVWSDHGDINAGRGSKTAISPTVRVKVFDKILNRNIFKFVPPAVGSGIRAVTYNPDVLPGDIYPHANIIDAGEAGLSGGNIFLQAQQVLNAGNVSSTFGAVVGLPQASSGTTNIGGLSGAGAVSAETSQMGQSATGVNSSDTARASQMVENIMTKWLDVRVIDFVEN